MEHIEANTNIETRAIPVEWRLLGDSKRTLAGRIPYNSLSEKLGSFRERIQPGAFRKSLANGDIRAFWNHQDDELPLGRTSSGTLRLNDGEDGLDFEIDLPDTTRGRDLAVSMARNDVRGMSFGFISSRDNWSEGGTIRTLIEADLIELSVVNDPAYSSATVGFRSLDAAKRSLEAWQKEQQPEPKPVENLGLLLDILERS